MSDWYPHDTVSGKPHSDHDNLVPLEHWLHNKRQLLIFLKKSVLEKQ